LWWGAPSARGGRGFPFDPRNVQRLSAGYFGVGLGRLDAKKQAMLERLRGISTQGEAEEPLHPPASTQPEVLKFPSWK